MEKLSEPIAKMFVKPNGKPNIFINFAVEYQNMAK